MMSNPPAKRVECLLCGTSYKNLHSYWSHKSTYHRKKPEYEYWTDKELTDNDPKIKDPPNTPTSSRAESVQPETVQLDTVKSEAPEPPPKKLKRGKVSAAGLCYRLTPNIDLSDITQILTLFKDLTRYELNFLDDDEKMYLGEMIRKTDLLKVFDEVRQDADKVRRIVKKLHVAKMADELRLPTYLQ